MSRAMMTFTILVLAAGLAGAQTPNGIPPANEGTCDDLMWATPGLYGLCVAFCEAQDCNPDLSQADPFAECNASAEKLLSIYNKKKQPADPNMPCVQEFACPCWTRSELDGLRYPSSTDTHSFCTKDEDRAGFLTNWDQWQMLNRDSTTRTTIYQTAVQSIQEFRDLGPRCLLVDRCDDGNCLDVVRVFYITDAEHAVCEAQLEEAGNARMISCF